MATISIAAQYAATETRKLLLQQMSTSARTLQQTAQRNADNPVNNFAFQKPTSRPLPLDPNRGRNLDIMV